MGLMWALLLAVSGCSNSGLGRELPDSGDSGSTPGTVTACPWVGTWDLVDVRCGSFPFPDWYDIFESARLDVSLAAGGSSCEVRRVLVGASCRETERMRWGVGESGVVTVASDGVISCAPAGCSYPTIGTCPEGARAKSTDSLDWRVDPKTSELELTDAQPDGTFVAGAAGCKLDVVTTWARRSP